MESIISFVWNSWAAILQSLSAIVAVCAAIAALTPTPKDDMVLRSLRKVIDILGMNIGHAKNCK